MQELYLDFFNEKNILLFWEKLFSINHINNIDVYLDSESADLLAIDSQSKKLILKIFAEKQCDDWTNIAETSSSDDEFRPLIEKDIVNIFKLLRQHQPPNIHVRYLSDWWGDYLYKGAFLNLYRNFDIDNIEFY